MTKILLPFIALTTFKGMYIYLNWETAFFDKHLCDRVGDL